MEALRSAWLLPLLLLALLPAVCLWSVTGADAVEFDIGAAAAQRGQPAPQPPCPFVRSNYMCSAEAVAANWRSCCADASCGAPCSSGGGGGGAAALRARTRVLFFGNSHIRELAEALVCDNLALLTGVTFMPNVTADARTLMMRGHTVPPLHWPYLLAAGLTDPDAGGGGGGGGGGAAAEPPEAPQDDYATYHFSNGALIHMAINVPPTLIAEGEAAPASSPFQLSAVADYLNFKFEDLTAVVANVGNFRGWAIKAFCGGDAAALPPPLPAFERTCDDLATYTPGTPLGRTPLIHLPTLALRLAAARFAGSLVVTDQVMEPVTHEPPLDLAATTAAAAAAGGRFKLSYVDMGSFIIGHQCSAEGGGACTTRPGHQCLPGPPNDGARIVLRQIYGA
ncbi:hypothetical protein JKP88DRAFT_252185 [Tribonema minus]|uniref:Uncharacterized protein n=1 Tax=Tribonema minus TaxID=303371 RepID=A0A836CME0_9STRA|nr:hypothetical protein JKP88DRAFT_252185 [Tribonema minus]